ncbi:flagellar hook-associated protein FlgK [Enterovirga sp.]|uniref:flagellar hook-associated protein FlgK n=1 Tax=Enterovirga sp. TaxID=2026350 RepID=UPI00262697CD|nr:flagellar hook-associated protein FlgK [Enterovirga sp.]MDB5592729.1 flgK [Enterovirga sp.]
MGLTSSIETAFSGLRAAQAGMDVVSQNVANASSVGYTRRVLASEQLVAGGRTLGVDVAGATRTLDTLVQRQLRLEQAGASYASVRASAHGILNRMFDQPGGTGSLATRLDTFTSKLQALTNNPSSYAARAEVVAAASGLAGSLNDLAGQVASLRQDSEDSLGRAVSRADSLLAEIAVLNGKLVGSPSAAMADQRDALIDELSTLMDLKVTAQPNGTVAVATTGGLSLVDGPRAISLSFDARPLAPGAAYDPDPARRQAGTITATGLDGVRRDALASGLIRSGEIAAHVELRDRILPQAQAQLDELAAGLAAALSDRTVAGTASSAGAASGFDLDLAALSAGNPITVSVRDPGGATRTLTFVRASSAFGVAAAAAAGQVAVDLSGGLAGAVATIGSALGPDYAVSNTSGATLRVLNNGGTSAVTALSAQATVTGLASGAPELPFFVDAGWGNAAFTGSFEAGSQLAGFAGRIAIHPGLVADNAKLISYGPSVLAGDTTRPALILDRLTSASRSFSGAAGIGGSSSAWTGTVTGFARQVISTQAADATAAASLDEGQQVVLNAVRSRFADQAGVNIDTELTQLIQLQTAYGANARLITASKEMLDLLMRIGG